MTVNQVRTKNIPQIFIFLKEIAVAYFWPHVRSVAKK